MSVTLRKSVVGFVALAALIGVYLLYLRANRMPPIAADFAKSAPVVTVPEVNAGPQGEVGTLFGSVGIDRVEQTQFVHRNERGQVDRILGFDQLSHKEGSQWEITKPYLKLLLPTFRCFVTANRGKIQVETVFERLTASDAFFSGNVVIHILPTESNDALECFIHLDDVSFLAAKSLFFSTGAVRFLSRRAQLTGTGMDLVYDEARSRLELFRIYKLDSLRGRSADLGSVADLTARPRPSQAAAAPGEGVRSRPDAGSPPALDDLHQCIFRGNVAIETLKGSIFARDEFAITDILWSGAKNRDLLTKPALDPNDPNAAPYPGPNALDTSVSSHSAISEIPPESFDMVVTCDGGFEVTPMGTRLKTADMRPQTETAQPRARDNTPSSAGPNRQRVAAQRIRCNSSTTDTTLEGPVEMVFPLDANGLQPAKDAKTAMSTTITAQKVVRYVAAAGQLALEGDCRATLVRSEPNVTYEYLLTAPRFLVDIASEPNQSKKKELAVAMRRFVTDGGPASLSIRRTRGERGSNQLLGWTQLDAAQVQYETEASPSASPGAAQARGARFTVLGPGVIWIRNAELVDPKADPNQFSLARPCMARLTSFDRLTYFTATNRIVAENRAQPLQLDYFPAMAGKYPRDMRMVAGHVEATLQEITKGHLELATLTATQGIEYEDETARQSFVGSTLSIDYAQSLLAVRGDAEQPCYLNGALVDHIDVNLKTGDLQTDVSGPGVFQVRR